MTGYLSVETDGCTYLVRADDENVGRKLFIRQSRAEMDVLDRVVKTLLAVGQAVVGRQFLDVGANIGTATIPALLRHGFGTAICFEPEPRNVLTLRLNLLLNGLEQRAETLQVALSNTTGTADFAVVSHESGKHRVVANRELRRRTRDTTLTTVRTLTLDQLVADGTIEPNGVGLLWLDTQGHEGHILERAKSLLDQGVPVVLEWAPRALRRQGHSIEDIAEQHYTHFLDMRPKDNGTGRPALHPSDVLREYAREFGPGHKYTDLLLVRRA
jgi:FkbM family methyltransferase